MDRERMQLDAINQSQQAVTAAQPMQ